MKLRFSLLTLLFLVIPIAWASLYAHHLLTNRPIEFTAFTWAEMERKVNDGNTVLLYCHPTYAVGDNYLPYEFSDSRLQRSFREGKFLAMKLKYDDWSGSELRNIFRQIGHTKYLMIILFRPDHAPERIDTIDIDQWFDRIALPNNDRYIDYDHRHLRYLGWATILVGATYVGRIVWKHRRKQTAA